MKALQTAFLALLSAFTFSVAQAGDYLTDFEAAQKKAAAEKKPLLVKFTGSDWCPPCMKLNREVFSKERFKKAVEKDFVVVVLDFPREKKLSEAETKANKRLAKKYGLESYPTVLLMDADGTVFKSFSGYNGENRRAYLANLRKALKARSFQ